MEKGIGTPGGCKGGEDAGGCDEERSPGGCRVTGTPRGCSEEGNAEDCKGEETPEACMKEEKLHGETWGLQSAPAPPVPCPFFLPSLQVIWGCTTPKPSECAPTKSCQPAAGQVDVCPSWVGKLEKCEVDTHMFIYSLFCLFPSPGLDSRRCPMGGFSVRWLQTALG